MLPVGKMFKRCNTFAEALGAVLTRKAMWKIRLDANGQPVLPVEYVRQIRCVTFNRTWPEASIEAEANGKITIYTYRAPQITATDLAHRSRVLYELPSVALQMLANEAAGFGSGEGEQVP